VSTTLPERERDRERDRLGPFIAVAVAVHAALFALSRPRPHVVAPSIEVRAAGGTLVNVDIDPLSERPLGPPGSGVPIAGGSKDGSDRPATPATPTKGARVDPSPVTRVEEPRAEEAAHRADVVAGASPTSPSAEPSNLVAVQAALESRQRGIEAAAAAAAGAGGPGNGGPGGRGAGWGAPPIRGANAFGNGSHGALTGRVCFLPVGTMRIADVRDCQYVATVYTDRLDIPERHFYDGFPGVSDRSDWFLIDYTGTFTVREYGSYEFRLHSDDGSYLYIDDKLVIENDGKHAPRSRWGSIPLVAGRHRIRVRYAQTNDRMALQLFVHVPQESEERIFTPQL
jgi:hypothetical protein